MGKYSYTDSCLEQAQEFGITDNLDYMVKFAARVTHPAGNFRYEDYVFLIEDDQVKSVSGFEDEIELEVLEVKDTHMKVKCPLCSGAGCFLCNQKGSIEGSVGEIQEKVSLNV